jgi:rod shape determining protein RodA
MDWLTILIYLALLFLGWFNIYAAVYDEASHPSLFDFSANAGRQFLFILTSFLLIAGILILDMRFYETFAYLLYGLMIVLMLGVLVVGKEVGGNKAWLGVGSFGGQPSEFAKFATALAVSRYIGSVGFRMENMRQQFVLFAMLAVPMGIILLQKDTGTALVFTSLVLVLFREGMSPFLLLVGLAMTIIFVLTLLVETHWILFAVIAGAWLVFTYFNRKKFKRILAVTAGALLVAGMVFSVDYVFTDVLKPHQQNRIKALINPEADPLGYGWNVTQSKIAIGSGGFSGKGFLKGTQTKFDFVPEQSTDFIFCTIGEEHGWVGCLIVIGLFTILLLRIVYLAERQKSRFARAFGYCTLSVLFFHYAINVGMTMGLFPVIGIPLPFFSYGGSALWGFTVLLFIFLKLDAHRMQVLQRL